MRSLLRLITLPYLRQNPLRTTLTIMGVAFGVALLVAIRVTNISTLRAFTETVDAIAGRTQLQVIGEVAGFDQTLYSRVRSFPGVAAAVPVVSGYATVEAWAGETLLVLGIDALVDRQVRDYHVVASQDDNWQSLRLLLDPSALFVSESFAQRHRLALGASLLLLTPRGRQSFVVRGLLAADGPAKALGGNLVIMDLGAAQHAFHKQGRLDRIDLTLQPGVSVESLQGLLQDRLGPGVRVDRPSFRNAAVEKMLRSFQVNLTALSMIALFVGMFLIYNTLSSAVVERRKDIATLRVVGADRRVIAGIFLAEGLAVGVIGTLVGIPLGLALARVTLYIVSQTLVSLFLVVAIERLVISPGVVLSALGVGILASVASVALPVREAMRVRPIDGLARAQYQQRPRPSLVRLFVPGMAWLLAGLLLTRLRPLGDVPLFGYLAAFALICGFSLVIPAAILGLTGGLRPALVVIFRGEGEVATEGLQSALSRSAVAAASLMTGVAMVVSVAIMIASFKRTVYTWVDQTVKGDLIISAASPSSGLSTMPLPESFARGLTDIAGILEVDALRTLSIPYQGRQVILNVADLDVFARHTEYPFLEGEPGAVFAEVIGQDSVIVSENFSYRFGLQRGDRLTLPTPEGPRQFRIAGVSIDYSSDQGTIVMHWGIFRRYWTERVVDAIGVFLRPGASVDAVAADIKRRFGQDYRLFVFSNQSFKEEIYRLIDQSFLITYALEVIAIVVCVLGITTALYTSVLDRTRETAVLRVLGAFRQQIRKIIMVESGLLGLLGIGVGTVCGVCLSVILVYIINRQSFGWTLRLAFPTWTITANLLLIFVASLLAGVWPAWRAARAAVNEVLRTE